MRAIRRSSKCQLSSLWFEAIIPWDHRYGMWRFKSWYQWLGHAHIWSTCVSYLNMRTCITDFICDLFYILLMIFFLCLSYAVQINILWMLVIMSSIDSCIDPNYWLHKKYLSIYIIDIIWFFFQNMCKILAYKSYAELIFAASWNRSW